MPTLSEDLAFRGLIHQVTDPALLKRLDAGGLTVYAGFDPTADSLRVGNMLQLCTLRRFQLAGHRPISLAGGGTGLIGDPGGKQDERAMLTREVLDGYLEGIRPQLGQFLDLSERPPPRQQRLARASSPPSTSCATWGSTSRSTRWWRRSRSRPGSTVPTRGSPTPSSATCCCRPTTSCACTSDHGCDLQIGGSDQWGNITMGVDYVRKVCGDEVWGLTTPLVLKADGTKFGKTETGNVWLERRPHQPVRHVPVLPQHARRHGRCLPALLHLPVPRGDRGARRRDGGAPRAPAGPTGAGPAWSSPGARRGGGDQVRRGVGRALRRGDRRAQRGDVAGRHRGRAHTEIARQSIADGLSLVDALERSGLAKSRSEARRTIERGGAYVNNVRQIRRRPACSAPTTSSTTATSSCARDAATSTSCARRRSDAPHPDRGRARPASVGAASCAGEDQMGSPAHRMSVWVKGTGFGEDIGTLVADNARIPRSANGTGAMHAACGTMEDDADMANGELPTPDAQVTDWLSDAYGLEGDGGHRLLQRRVAPTRSCWPRPRRHTAKAQALFSRALIRIQSIDGRLPSTTTTTDNGPSSIFG